MIHAYDKNYLTAAQKCLARMLDYMVNDLQYPLETVWNWFLMSEISHRFELGDSTILAGTSGVELARRVLEQGGNQNPSARHPMRMIAAPNTGQAGLLRITNGIQGFDTLKLSRLCRFPRCGCCIRPTTKWMFASLQIR